MSVRITAHLGFGEPTRSRVAIFPDRPPMAFVEAAGVEFTARSPADLLAVAAAFTNAAARLSEALDEGADVLPESGTG